MIANDGDHGDSFVCVCVSFFFGFFFRFFFSLNFLFFSSLSLISPPFPLSTREIGVRLQRRLALLPYHYCHYYQSITTNPLLSLPLLLRLDLSFYLFLSFYIPPTIPFPSPLQSIASSFHPLLVSNWPLTRFTRYAWFISQLRAHVRCFGFGSSPPPSLAYYFPGCFHSINPWAHPRPNTPFPGGQRMDE